MRGEDENAYVLEIEGWYCFDAAVLSSSQSQLAISAGELVTVGVQSSR